MEQLYELTKPVVRIETPEVASGEYLLAHKKEAALLDPNVEIISDSRFQAVLNSNDQRPAEERYTLPADVKVGDILVKHPYHPNTYIFLEELETKICDALYSDMEKIAQHLGCTRMSWSVERRLTSQRTWNASTGVEYAPVVKSAINYDSNTNSSVSSSVLQEINMSGYKGLSKEDIEEEYAYAKSLVEKYGLKGQDDIDSLIECRNPARKTSLLEKKVTIHLSAQFNRNVEAAFSLNAMSDVFSLRASIKQVTDFCKQIDMHYTLSFVEHESIPQSQL